MKALPSFFVFFALAVVLACGPELDLDPPPDLDADTRLAAFENPDAEVLPDIMAGVAGSIQEVHDEVEQSSFYEEILGVIVDVQEELYNEDGQVDLGGVAYDSPNGGVTVDYICEGWDDPPPAEPDPANGSMRLNMRLASGTIAPLVWGSLDDCKYPAQVESARLDALYTGAIAIYFEDALASTTDVHAQPVTFITRGLIVVEGREFPIEELFRVTFYFDEEGNLIPSRFALDVLVELADSTSFVYSFDPDLGQRLTDATGTLTCSLENRECTSPSGSFSW